MTDAPTIDPTRAALLVMDYQTGIVGRFDDADVLLARVQEAIATARAHGMQIGYVRVALTDEDAANVPPANKTFAAAAASRRMHADDPATAIHERVAPQTGDVVVRKSRVGPFSTTDLDAQLRDRGIDTLVLAGISTSGVVLSTVRQAADHDYDLYVLADACADTDNEVHRVLLDKVFPRQAKVVQIADLDGLLSAG
jgi:nicotinamidase-related amidase